ncbi:ABC transporter substrate-binding protein [Streptomyces mirabilis]|uniref:ABC transporter substrate-binding protein n=1 Tax=Streptomyces mirabilis TaxID=68239 RepID=UPI0036EDF35E
MEIGSGAVLGGRYKLSERIGAGGMGVVWQATDARLDRAVAVKLLNMPAGLTDQEQERFLGMFMREARAAAALESAYIVPVFDHSSEDDTPYLVMPLLNGRTVRELLDADGPLEPSRAADIAAQVCRALTVAHRAGIVHRDIKPPNVILTNEGTVKVLDFGVAKFMEATAGAGFLTRSSDSPVGTLHYMAPERFTQGGDVSAGDLYSLGCMLNEMLTGVTPFTGASAAVLMHGHVYEEPQRPSELRPDLDGVWDELVLQLLAKDPAARSDAASLAGRLDALARVAAPVPEPVTAALPDPAPPTSYVIAPTRPVAPAPRRALWVTAVAVLAAGVLTATLLALAPWEGSTHGGDRGGITVAPAALTQTLSEGTTDDSKGPAPAVKGAKRGGTITILEPHQIKTIDPGNAEYRIDSKLMQLAYRSLTGLKTAPDGTVRVVGDLADDAGTASDGNRTWTFHLKSGVTYDNGARVTAKDFAHAVERTLDPSFNYGYGLLRGWLLGPKGSAQKAGAKLPAGAIDTPDDRTVVFHLAVARADFNVALSGPAGAPVPAGWNEKPDAYEAVPTTGPYRITSSAAANKQGKVTLTRNTHWQPASDPLRTAYPDKFIVDSTVAPGSLATSMEKLATKPVMTFTGDPTVTKNSTGAATAGLQVLKSPVFYVASYVINTKRVPDLAVRRAIALAMPSKDVLAAFGKPGTITHHLLPPGVPGSKDFYRFPAGDNGDADEARSLLAQAGKLGTKLTLTVPDDRPVKADEAMVVQQALTKAGLTVAIHVADTSTYFSKTGSYDIFYANLETSLPIGSTDLPDNFGSNGQALGIQFSDKDVDRAIDKANAAPDLKSAGPLWADVDRQVMGQMMAVPVFVPIRPYPESKSVHGLQTDLHGVSALNAYVTES